MFKRSYYFLLCALLLCSIQGSGQKKSAPKYPSLLWEISGNGLTRPSYLFGTMHVSSKMVFHLSDSFYIALKNVDAVALELNPDLWQGQMVSLNRQKQNYVDFVRTPRGDYLTENSFRITKYDDELKAAMSSEPTIVNSLLYRSYKEKEDFEEDTFLDLYIFQTGKKLGKRSTGVEDYYETEKIVLEAYSDMAKEKKKKSIDLDGESRFDFGEKLQEAYRRGDLDMMDSLNRMVDRSDAFTEKFLFKRNEVQAHSIDTIIKKNSLFVGVGAAHLPGPRGIIELLRKMGYRLRPIKMNDRDAMQKEVIDRVKVPVSFSTQVSDDGFYSVSMPGPLYKLSGEYQDLDRRQYSDMSNGSYYLVTRVKTHAPFFGQDEKEVFRKVDSFLYENIPGKILSRKLITKNGYTGYDISNRTRRGDLQRYNIFVTPYEILFFKMSGKENYVEGKEADQFFSSIQLKKNNSAQILFEPGQGGFSVNFPSVPDEYLDNMGSDGIDRWEYQSVNKANGDAYLVFAKSIYNFRFLDQDTFDLGLVEESFRDPDRFDKQLKRQLGTCNGYPSLDITEKLKDGSLLKAKFIIKGPHYYVLAARSKDLNADLDPFFSSFRFTPFRYGYPSVYTDTFMHFRVNTPVAPQLNEDLRQHIENAGEDLANGYNPTGFINYWPKTKNGLFKSDSTGEVIGVSIQEYPRYYYVKDSAKFWIDEISEMYKRADLYLYRSDSLTLGDRIKGYRFMLRDSGSSRTITRMVMLKDNYTFSLVTMGDTLTGESSFISSFFNSFTISDKKPGRNIYENRLDEFFTDLFSKDSVTQARAKQALSNVYFGEKGVPRILDAISRLDHNDKDYFNTKTKLIAELGYIKDTIHPVVVEQLRKIYEQAGDTTMFQDEVLTALSRHKTKAAYSLFKELILQDPPVFENNYDYSGMFSNLEDSLLLAKDLFPELLELSSLSDYKENVLSLLGKLVDSNIVKAGDYEKYFSKIWLDARVELKRQRVKDEKIMEKEAKKDDEDNNDSYVRNFDHYGKEKTTLDEYSVLIVPFYSKNNAAKTFFEQLLRSRDDEVRLNTAVLLLRNNIPVADSILLNLAASDQYRGTLYTGLEKAKRPDQFPAKYKNQADLARSYLMADKDYDKVDSIIFLKKQPAAYLDKKGTVYFFKYRVKKEDDWKIGISGLQPEDENKVSSDDKLVSMTDVKIKADEPLDDQLRKQLKKLLFGFHKSGKNFYGYGAYNYRRAGRVLDKDDDGNIVFPGMALIRF